MTNKRSIIKILEVSCVIFFSCYTIVPWIVYDQQKTTYIQKELIIELKKVSISEDVKEIYVNKAKRFGDRITTLELVFSRETNFRNLVDSCKRNGWNVKEDNAQENKTILKRNNFYIKIYNDKQNIRLKIWKI